ncbi:MAG: HYR domain-containing protein [Verrucomicrobiota bacterium]|nr:HYR domain-containing protein [Verrucomicrobiota bacterium]
MKKSLINLLGVAMAAILPVSAQAALIGVVPGFPKLNYTSTSGTAVNYDSVSDLMVVTAPPATMQFSSSEGLRLISGTRSFTMQAVVDDTGALVGGVAGHDVVLNGTVSRLQSGVTTTYTGVLLTGEVIAFGWLESGVTDQYDFRFQVTGGELAPLFAGAVLSVTVTSESSTFTGSFESNFTGRAKGVAGAEVADSTAPTITCPPNLVVETHTSVNGVAGAYVTYATPSVTDDTDLNPTIVCTPPPGSFFPLEAGLGSTNHTVTCVATDAAGNSATCTFIITVQDTLPPEFADVGNPVIDGCDEAIILTNDVGQCVATFEFPRPFATDGSASELIPVEVSALDENGITIPLIDLGNNLLRGIFPVNITGSNVVTLTANDGRGNSAQRQCFIVVVDKEAPMIACVDQTATFKPVFTNALSSISASFSCHEISSNHTIWFNSSIRTPSSPHGNFSVRFYDQTIEIQVGDSNITTSVPDAIVHFVNNLPVATTTFSNGEWVTTARPKASENTFLSGVAFDVPFDFEGCRDKKRCSLNKCDSRGRRHKCIDVTWSGRFQVDDARTVVKWQWGAAVYTNFSTDYNALGVKPVDSFTGSVYQDKYLAGTPENFKNYVIVGARGEGRNTHGNSRWDKYTGELTHRRKANLGMGTVCFGAVDFTAPVAADNCSGSVTVTLNPPSGSIFGPGDHTIVATAVDGNGNTNECSFTLTVLSPLQVVFDCPLDDNLNDNTCQPDAGFSDMNCPDDPGTPQIVNRFSVCDTVLHSVRLLDCNGEDVTSEMAPYVTVRIDVTYRIGSYPQSFLLSDVPQNYSYIGSPGGVMVPINSRFKYNLNTAGFPGGSLYTQKFFRSCVWVEYNSSPGVVVGMEDVILESR